MMENFKTQKLGELRPSDITSSVCNKCIKKGPPHCCEMTLNDASPTPMFMELIKRAVEGYGDHLRVSDGGEIILTCSHLDKENGVCTIYKDRPQICRDYNCVSWAQVDFGRGVPKERLIHYNKIEKMLKEEKEQKRS